MFDALQPWQPLQPLQPLQPARPDKIVKIFDKNRILILIYDSEKVYIFSLIWLIFKGSVQFQRFVLLILKSICSQSLDSLS